MVEFIIANMAPLMFGSLVLFLLFGYPVAFALAANGIVFAAAIARAAIFSEARFKYRAFENGQPGRIYGDNSLAPLERFPGGQTSVDFLARLVGHADFAGNAFVVRGDGGLITLRPDWVVPVIGSRYDPVDSEAAIPDAEMIGLVYYPGGKQVAKVGRVYLPGEFFKVAKQAGDVVNVLSA